MQKTEKLEQLERDIIGLIINNKANLAAVRSVGLKPHHMSNENYAEILSKIIEIDSNGLGFEFDELILQVPHRLHLPLSLIGGLSLLTADPTFHAQALVANHWKREVLQQAGLIIKMIEGSEVISDIKPIAAAVNNLLEDLPLPGLMGGTKEPKDLAMALLETLMIRADNFKEGKTRGFSTGLSDLDLALDGICPSRLYILGARPAVGKSTFAVNLVHAAVRANVPTLFFSLEMSDEEIAEKYVSRASGVSGQVINNGDFKDNEDDTDAIVKALDDYTKIQFRVNHLQGKTLNSLISETRRLFRQGKVGFLIVDYVQLMHLESDRYKHRHLELSEISAALKQLAMELRIPVLALAQVNRDVAEKNQMPQLHHLKDSGSLEQDADVVLLLHREWDEKTKEQGHTWLNVAKNRHGRTGAFKIKADLAVNKFGEM